jgi:protease-4
MSFLKTLGATILGFFVSIIILIILFFIFVIVVSHFTGPSEPKVSDNSVLVMNIRNFLPDRSPNNPFEHFFHPLPPAVSLNTLKKDLKKAQTDKHIKGVVLKINNMNESWANLQEAYRAIAQFRDSSSKFIYATTNDVGFNQKGYYLAAATDSVFSPPQSFFQFNGFYMQVTYYKGLLDTLGIKTDIARHGKFKSAVEPFMRKNMSPADKEQLGLLLNETTRTFLEAVSHKSGKSISQLNAMLNKEPHLSAEYGYNQNLIDSLLYVNQLDSLIKKRMGLKSRKSTFHTISGNRYALVSPKAAGLHQSETDGTIAVLYANGMIMNGGGHSIRFGQQHILTAPWFRKQLHRITDNHRVKALVIRINSPGGSGSASDAIWNMIRQTTQKMPVVVSMGAVDASGGYYISSAADAIVADPMTITGSIGVFAIHFNANQFFNDKLGITFDNIKSNKHADWLSPVHKFTRGEKKAFKANITAFYHNFLQKVAEGRGMSVEQVDKIAQGRVWSGKDAKKHHLVDTLGGLQKALRVAADKAGITHYKTLVFPKQKGFLHQLFTSSKYRVQSTFSKILGSNQLKKLNEINKQMHLLKQRGAWLLFPYQIKMR